jgi:hypothetical protein
MVEDVWVLRIIKYKENIKMKSTKDLYLAACYMALGAKYEKSDKTDKRHIVFYFTPKPLFETGVLAEGTENAPIPAQDLDKIESDWANGCVLVNAIQYKDALQRLKSIIHSD